MKIDLSNFVNFIFENYNEVEASKIISKLNDELAKASIEIQKPVISSKRKLIYTSIKDYIKSCEFYNHVENKAYKVGDVENLDYQTLYDLCLRCDNEFDIKFDFENILMEDNDMNGIYGFHTLPNGMEILGLVIGGDWEIPVNVILYCKDGRLHNYIPKFGNCYNHETNEAYLNEDIDNPHFCFINFNYDKDKMIEEILSKF